MASLKISNIPEGEKINLINKLKQKAYQLKK